jgi:small ligand-binding sensory domain FIST
MSFPPALATALVSANEAHPQLAEEAVQQALAKAGLRQANSVLLFLTPEFSRHAQAAVTAAARAAQCTQVTGGIASGVLTETGWALDRPAAAVMVMGGELSLGFPSAALSSAPSAAPPADLSADFSSDFSSEFLSDFSSVDGPLLSYASGTFPAAWSDSTRRFGSTFSGSFSGTSADAHPAVWQHSRLCAEQRLSVSFNAAELAISVSSGRRRLGPPLRIDNSLAYDLQSVGGQSAADSLRAALPAELAGQQPLPLHLFSACLIDTQGRPGEPVGSEHGGSPSTPIIAVNADGSLTLSERPRPGQWLVWCMRHTETAVEEMRQGLESLSARLPHPAAALMFSCIGRGPYFYGGEDRDLRCLCERFPGLPVLGTYGTGQIAPADRRAGYANRQLENTVVTALIGHQRPATPER